MSGVGRRLQLARRVRVFRVFRGSNDGACGARGWTGNALMRISGMTGFGRAEGSSGAWSWAVEARSVNGRNLEVRFRGPPGFEGLERSAREGAQARFQRGQLTVGVQAKRVEGAASVKINHEQI